jgi:uncharacterized RDD family membrane protein YckC
MAWPNGRSVVTVSIESDQADVQASSHEPVIDPFEVAPDRDLNLQGHYAGFVTRSTALVIDIVAIVLISDIVGAAVQFVVSTLLGHQFRLTELPVLPWLGFTIWAVLYCTYPVATVGKTLGMAIVGLRVVRSDGSRVGAHGAILRFVALPLSFITLGFGFLLILLRRDHRALQDLIGGTAVIYGWDARAARLRILAGRDAASAAGPASAS